MTAACNLLAVEKPGGDVRIVRLHVRQPFTFKAGQYLNILHPGGAAIPFSIASAPTRLPELEIHFRPAPGVPEADLMLELLEAPAGAQIDIDGPFGEVWVEALTSPLLIIAGGTGAAQAHAILSHLTAGRDNPRLQFLWSLASTEAAYFTPDYPGVDTTLVVDEGTQPGALLWLTENEPDLHGVRIILCGPPGFVYALNDALIDLGASQAQLHADAFAYAPRAG